MTRYLDAAQSAVQILLEKQTAREGGKPDGTLCLTVTRMVWDTTRVVGAKRGEKLLSYFIEGSPMEMRPTRLDLRSWPMLELLSEVTGDPRYRAMVAAMADVFVRHGFDAASGLGYLGEEADLDVEKLTCASVYVATPQFKPLAYITLEPLWAAAPQATARMIRSAYYGLITRPATMDYNRHCYYGFDDSKKTHPNPFNSHNAAFAMTGALLVHWWGILFTRTGEADCLKWAQGMADKWKAVQHPESGLMPGWFGSDHNDGDIQPPRPFCNYWETITGITYLRAAEQWKLRPEGKALARQLEDMGLRLLKGYARHVYDPQTRTFSQWTSLDGSPRTQRAWYTFHTQAEKDEAMKTDPVLSEVPVFSRYGFYVGLPWVANAGMTAYGNNTPHDVTLGARMSGDAYLLSRARYFAEIVIEEARKLTGEFTASGQWTMPANALYVKMMVNLFEMTHEQRYLDWAREIADLELEFLSRPLPAGKPEWWRLLLRNSWIEALLLLHRACDQSGNMEAPAPAMGGSRK